jgi:hypothetical protein
VPRQLFNIVALLSLLVALAVAALWVRSYFASDAFFPPSTLDKTQPQTHLRQNIVYTNRGAIVYLLIELRGDPADDYHKQSTARIASSGRHVVEKPEELPSLENSPLVAVYSSRGFLGFQMERAATATFPPATPDIGISRFIIPLWFPLVLSLVLPAAWFWHWRRLRLRNRVGKCQRCGYDMRATPERCPECGAMRPGTAPDHGK